MCFCQRPTRVREIAAENRERPFRRDWPQATVRRKPTRDARVAKQKLIGKEEPGKIRGRSGAVAIGFSPSGTVALAEVHSQQFDPVGFSRAR